MFCQFNHECTIELGLLLILQKWTTKLRESWYFTIDFTPYLDLNWLLTKCRWLLEFKSSSLKRQSFSLSNVHLVPSVTKRLNLWIMNGKFDGSIYQAFEKSTAHGPLCKFNDHFLHVTMETIHYQMRSNAINYFMGRYS